MSISPDFCAASTPADESDSVMRIEHGDKIWRNKKNERHRTDGPAIENADGSKEWWVNDQLHRTDGPAIENADGSKHWWVNDQRHRTDGPAIENADGAKEWWVNGNELTADEISEQLEKLAAEKKARERALADAAHQRTLARLDQLAGRVTRNRRSQP